MDREAFCCVFQSNSRYRETGWREVEIVLWADSGSEESRRKRQEDGGMWGGTCHWSSQEPSAVRAVSGFHLHFTLLFCYYVTFFHATGLLHILFFLPKIPLFPILSLIVTHKIYGASIRQCCRPWGYIEKLIKRDNLSSYAQRLWTLSWSTRRGSATFCALYCNTFLLASPLFTSLPQHLSFSVYLLLSLYF
jgi:hypothetical protein